MPLTRRRTPDRAWHRANPRPPRGTPFEERLVWHRAHVQHCGCTPPPWGIYQALKARGWWPEDLT